MRRKGVTSIDLAKIAGVSSATISRAFRNLRVLATAPTASPRVRRTLSALTDPRDARARTGRLP
jgi:DNA-binding LacI/PurR family transcriptional regulator